ncbi:MAG: 16S rRNA (uracil(1498)-N(3))-methyltransferase, partial [bacterium]|nr:16S rRNA (uracil(1498)-N(3))-methyltransferase [bacterium]
MHTYHFDPPAGAPLPGAGEEVRLDAEESHHLLHVMRARPGDPVRLVDGRAGVVLAEYAGADAGRARVLVRASHRESSELARPRLVLACGVAKGKRFEAMPSRRSNWARTRSSPCRPRAARSGPARDAATAGRRCCAGPASRAAAAGRPNSPRAVARGPARGPAGGPVLHRRCARPRAGLARRRGRALRARSAAGVRVRRRRRSA